MSSDNEKPAEDVEAQTATLVSSDALSGVAVKRWKFENLEKKELRKTQAIRQEVLDQLRKEVEPEVHEQATLIKRKAFDEAQKQGYEEGFKQGVKAGKLEGKHQAEKEADAILKPQVEALQDLAEFMITPYQELSEQIFKQLSQISIAIAEKIVEKELKNHHDWVVKAIHESIEKLPKNNDALEITVNPVDKALLESYVSEHEKPWKLLEDETIESGCCRVSQNASTVVNNWREKLDSILEETYNVAENLASESHNENELSSKKSVSPENSSSNDS